MGLILNAPVKKTAVLLLDANREINFTGVTIGRFGFGVLINKKRNLAPFAADFAICASDLHTSLDEQGFLFCGFCGRPLSR